MQHPADFRCIGQQRFGLLSIEQAEIACKIDLRFKFEE